MRTVGLALVMVSSMVACQKTADQPPRAIAETPIGTTTDAHSSSNDVPDPNASSTSTDVPDPNASATSTDAPDPNARSSSTLDNTAWDFCGTPTTVGFHFGGSLAFMDSSDRRHRQTCTDGRWRQSGNHVTFDCNGFTFYDVVITAPDAMSGTWHRAASPDEKSRTCLRKRGG